MRIGAFKRSKILRAQKYDRSFHTMGMLVKQIEDTENLF